MTRLDGVTRRIAPLLLPVSVACGGVLGGSSGDDGNLNGDWKCSCDSYSRTGTTVLELETTSSASIDGDWAHVQGLCQNDLTLSGDVDSRLEVVTDTCEYGVLRLSFRQASFTLVDGGSMDFYAELADSRSYAEHTCSCDRS